MNLKIVVCVSIALLSSLVAIIYFQSVNPDPLMKRQDEFYSQPPESNKDMVLLLGASHVGQLNTTKINEIVSETYDNFVVYNLAYNGDNPQKRFSSMVKILALKPKIIVYGISYRDFESKTLIENDWLRPDQLVGYILQIDTTPFQINPKLTTLQAIRDAVNDDELFASRRQMTIPNTPFFPYHEDQLVIIPNAAINNMAGTTEGAGLFVETPEKTRQLVYLKKMIDVFSDNEIKIALFSAPLHQTYLADLPDTSKTNFSLILDDVAKNHDVKLYNYTSKYSQLNIWANTDHVAYNKMSMVYSEDIAQIILGEAGN